MTKKKLKPRLARPRPGSLAEGPDTFDRQVWGVIETIPPGRVMTYGQIARHLGTKAYRAVGRACGKSPGMPAVPCHRVVSGTGLLHGFNGGLEKKRSLLEAEGLELRPRQVGGVKDYEVVDFAARLLPEERRDLD